MEGESRFAAKDHDVAGREPERSGRLVPGRPADPEQAGVAERQRHHRRGKILFINAVNEVTRERAQSFLTDEHLQRVVRAYQDYQDEPGFTRVVSMEEIRAKDGNLSIPLYVGSETQAQTDAAAESATTALQGSLASWLKSAAAVRLAVNGIPKFSDHN